MDEVAQMAMDQPMEETIVDSPLKWFGGKAYLARRIVGLMPPHLHYVEPFAGSLAVLLERDPNDRRLWVSECAQRGGVSEVANDLHGQLTNFWEVLKWDTPYREFTRLMQATALNRTVFEEESAYLEWDCKAPRPCVRCASAFFVACRQSRAGTFKGFTSLTRSRTRRGINGNVSEWLGAVDMLPAVHARLQPVVIENMDALKLIEREDAPDTLFYCDPPYMHGTRSAGGYDHEMSDEGHHNLLCLLRQCKGKVMLSGYRSPMYDDLLSNWKRHEFNLPNHAAGGKVKRRMVECVWVNF